MATGLRRRRYVDAAIWSAVLQPKDRFRKRRLACALQSDLAQQVRDEVRTGHAASVSAYIAEAVEEKREKDRLQEVLAAMNAKYGPLAPEELEWADRALLED